MHQFSPDHLKAKILLAFKRATKEDILIRLKEVHLLTETLLNRLYQIAMEQREKAKFYSRGMNDEVFAAVFDSMRAGSHEFREILLAFDNRTIDRIDYCIWGAGRLLPSDGIGQTMQMVLTDDWFIRGRVRRAIEITAAAVLSQLPDVELPPRDPISEIRSFAFSSGE